MEYVDRITEYNTINDLYKGAKQSSLLIVFSKTGIGKSSLSHKFTDKIAEGSSTDIIYIITNQLNNCSSNNGSYLMDVFKWIYKFYKNDKEYSFEKYIFKNKTYKKYIIGKIISESQTQESFKSLVFKVFGINILKRIFKIDEFDYETLFDDYSKKTNKIIKDYIGFILSKRKTILVIDNMQNIDEQSLEIILDWLVEYKEQKHFILFEYTVDDSMENMLKLRDRINNYGICFNLLELNCMEPNDAIEAAKLHAQDNKNEVINIEESGALEYYNKVDGNIRALEDYIRGYNRNNHKHNINSATYDTILSLKKEEALLLSLLCLNDSRINKYMLADLLRDYSSECINESLNVLIKTFDFVVLRDDDYYIKHASIFDNWLILSNTNLKSITLVAYSLLKNYYNNILENVRTSNNHKVYLMLIKLYSKYEPDKIYDLLTSFDDVLQEFLTPSQLEEYIKLIDIELSDHVNEYEDFFYKLIDICLNVKLYNLADSLLEEVFNNSNLKKYVFYKCNILLLKEDHNENIKFINGIIQNISDEYFMLYLKLFLMVSYRSINKNDMVLTINNEIKLIINEYYDTLFYGFYLRLSEIRKSRNDAIKDVESSIIHFKKLNYRVQVAKSQVALSFLYAVTGRINEAVMESDKAEKIIVKDFANRHIFYNNKAAMYLLDGNTGNEILSMLKAAEEYAIGTFDKLAIYNNILVYSYEINDNTTCRIYAAKINAIINSEPDKHILAIIYYNLHKYYDSVSNYSASDECFSKAYSLKEHCKSLNARLTNSTVDDGTQILISKPWHVCFLDYWNIDYCEDFN